MVAPQLRGTFPTLIEQYEQTISNEAAVDNPQDTKETAG